MNKKVFSFIALLTIAVGLFSCGGSHAGKSEGFKVPTILNGPLGEYYDIVSVNVRPFNEEEKKEVEAEKLEENTFYKIIVEVKKNAKAFDFDTSKIQYTSYVSDDDTNIFCIAGLINNEEGGELAAFSFKRKGGVESLLLTCSKEGASKTISADFHVKKDKIKGNEAIELTSVLKTAKSELEELKEGVKMLKEMKESMSDDKEDTETDVE